MALSALAFLLAAALFLAGVGIVGAAFGETCAGEEYRYGPSGTLVEHRKVDCTKSPELIPYGLAVVGGGALAMWGIVAADRRRFLGPGAALLGPVPALPLMAVSVLGLIPLLLIPVGAIGIVLRALSHLKPTTVSAQ